MSQGNLIAQEIAGIGDKAVAAAYDLVKLSSDAKNRILESMAAALEEQREKILAGNAKDLAAASELSEAFRDRLTLTPARFKSMVQGLRELIDLPDPVGKELSRVERPNGLIIRKVRVPLGVIAIIYESRPNVTVDAAGLCLKTSNAVILRGGSESLQSNQAIVEALVSGGRKTGMPENVVQLVTTKDREAVRELVQLEGKVDVVIPRGGEGLIRAVAEMARVPVLKHYKGVCHTYVDKDADFEMALTVCENAKCQRPGVCNAIETLLVHREAAPSFLPRAAALLGAKGVELRGDTEARAIVPEMKEATEQDWYEEYLDLILAVRVVPHVEAAIEHINTYGSRHTDAIISKDRKAQEAFTSGVDSGVVLVNASTRFNDGGEFGMGAEMGISTDKLHARGPVGPEELTSYKYIVEGSGQVRG